MDIKIYNKLIEIMNKKNKKIIVADSQKDTRFSNEHVYKNLEKVYNKDIK